MRWTSLLLCLLVASTSRAQTSAPVPAGEPTAPAPAAGAGEARPGDVPPAVSVTPPVPPSQPTWPAHGVPSVGTWDIVATGALAAAALTVEFAIPSPTVPKWTAQNGFDTGIRDALRIGSDGGRAAAGTTSDVLVFTLIAAPFVNATLVAGIEHDRWDVAWRLMVLDTETILLATTITISLQKATARERPYVQECQTSSPPSQCSGGGFYTSFPSGHTTAAFAAVALECFHHGYLDTSHTGWGAVACPVTVVAAVGTGILRIAADRHWATDIIAGAAIGGLVGYAVPALHLLGSEKQTGPVVVPTISSSTIGVSLAGRF